MSCKMKHIERDDKWCLRISLTREQNDYAKWRSRVFRSVGEVDIHAHFGHLISAVLLVKEITICCNWAHFFMPRENELREQILRT